MFKQLSDMAGMMKAAQQIQANMDAFQEQLKKLRVEGSAGGGMVVVVVNGQQQMQNCRIEPSLFASGDREMLEDLIVAASLQAYENAKLASRDLMAEMSKELNIPGLGDALSKMNFPM